jgi:hypothetical protein
MEHERGAFKVNRGPVGYAVKKGPQNDAFHADLMPVCALRCKKYRAVNLDKSAPLLIK